MRLFLTIILILTNQLVMQAQGKWRTAVYWGEISIQFFAKEIINPNNYPNNKQQRSFTEETFFIGDTLAMYIYRNKKWGSSGGTMYPARSRMNVFDFVDSIIFDNISLKRILDNITIINDKHEDSSYFPSKQLSISLNDKFLYEKLNIDYILKMPVGTKLRDGEITEHGKEKMLLLKYPMQYQDKLTVQITDIKSGIQSGKYKFQHIDPFPQLVNYYDLNQKNIFEVIKNRDSIQFFIDSLSLVFKEELFSNKNTDDENNKLLKKYGGKGFGRALYKYRDAQEINLKNNENNVLLLFQRFNNTDTLKLLYQFIDEKKKDTTWYTASDVFILQFTNLIPGKKYYLNVKYNLTPYAVSKYIFSVEIKWWQTTLAKLLLAFIIGAAVLGIGWIIYRKRQVKKLEKEQREKEQLNMQFDSVRSQLNPHFIFNALASLQSLINKNNIHQANLYLSQISTLMRETLVYSKQAMISLGDEVRMVKNYVEIEQLRSPFHYSITIDPHIEENQIDIPAMLLQPVVENSIKHALSVMLDGKLTIRIFMLYTTDLCIEIKDNGKGFDISTLANKGHGLRLTEERVNLFNKLYQHCSIQFTFISEPGKGTTSTFIFINWMNI